MTSNRSQGGHSERINLQDLDPSAKVGVCRLLNALMNATVKQLNNQSSTPGAVERADCEIADTIAELALHYKAHLSHEDPVQVATLTSEDLLQLKSLMDAVESSKRLDAVIAATNEILDDDNITFTRNEQEIWLGRRVTSETPYYLSARVTVYDYFDAEPPAR